MANSKWGLGGLSEWLLVCVWPGDWVLWGVEQGLFAWDKVESVSSFWAGGGRPWLWCPFVGLLAIARQQSGSFFQNV